MAIVEVYVKLNDATKFSRHRVFSGEFSRLEAEEFVIKNAEHFRGWYPVVDGRQPKRDVWTRAVARQRKKKYQKN